MFEFEVDGRKYLILLSGGASANKGQDFEDRITLGLKDAIGLSIGDIEDEQIKQWNTICDRINFRINKGHTSVEFPDNIYAVNINRLTHKGYKLFHIKSGTQISW